jgi:hypothetical protein
MGATAIARRGGESPERQAVRRLFWESEADIAASDELGSTARNRIQEIAGGQGAIEREDWEVVIDDMT